MSDAAAVPSIKATYFQFASDDLARLLDEGRLTPSDLERRLPAEDLAYLGKQLAASAWVPMTTYVRVSSLTISLLCDGDREAYLRQAGVRAAARLHKMGIYKQFEASSEKWGPHVGRILVTLATVTYNFTRWTYEDGDDDASFRVVIEEARDFPEMLRTANEGFISYLWNDVVRRGKTEVTSERVSRDRIVFAGRTISGG